MKTYLTMILLMVAPILAQCDWNGDGSIDVLDIVQTVDCILSDCWDVDVYGCMDPEACNYNQDANVDDGSCLEWDCLGDCGGDAVVDDCGICEGYNESMDCAGVCEGSAYENECGCVGGTTGLEDDFCYGCMDPEASNYNPDAIFNEGDCEFSDFDGNIYTSVIIGEQEWMVENLRVTHYRNGDPITTGYSGSEWLDLEETEIGAYAIYPWDFDDESQNTCGYDCADVYGHLYNGYAAEDSRSICPESWHVPTHEEWQQMVDYLGGNSIAGGPLKAVGTIQNGDGLWNEPNTGATNESGFTGLPGGSRGGYFDYGVMGDYGYFWTNTALGVGLISSWRLYRNNTQVWQSYNQSYKGYSVRCIRDEP